MPLPLLRRTVGWLTAALVALLVLGPAGSPVQLFSVAALAVAVVLTWSLVRPSGRTRHAVGRRHLAPVRVVAPVRSSDPDAAGRSRPRAPSA
jgi:hypothetical protein